MVFAAVDIVHPPNLGLIKEGFGIMSQPNLWLVKEVLGRPGQPASASRGNHLKKNL